MAQEQPTTVFEIMTRTPIRCKVKESLQDVIERISQAEVNALLVVDEQNIVRGIISQTDILEHYAEIDEVTAGDVMNRELVWIQPDESIEQATQRMVKTKALRLVVPDADHPGRAAGIVSASDIIRTMVELEFQKYLPVKL